MAHDIQHYMRPGTLQLGALPPLSLYVHLPWCIRKCPYCDFNSHEAKGAIPEGDYIVALIADLEAALPLIWGRRVTTIFIGGGKAHGPRLREFNVSLNKKVRALGLKMALSSKAKGGLVVVDNLDTDGKTKALAASLAKANWGRKVLVIDGEAVNAAFAQAAGNLPGVNVLPAIGANVYDILKHDTLVLTRAAVEKLEARFNG